MYIHIDIQIQFFIWQLDLFLWKIGQPKTNPKESNHNPKPTWTIKVNPTRSEPVKKKKLINLTRCRSVIPILLFYTKIVCCGVMCFLSKCVLGVPGHPVYYWGKMLRNFKCRILSIHESYVIIRYFIQNVLTG